MACDLEDDPLRTVCILCDERFTNVDNLKRHIQYHTGELVKCDTVSETTKNTEEHQDHVQGSRHCSQCRKSFKSCSVHYINKETDKPFSCDICNKEFRAKYNLKIHINIHNRTHYECDTCGRMFNKARACKKHKRTHVRRRPPFSCNTCGTKFKQKVQYVFHIKVHIGHNRIRCFCGNTYSNYQNFFNHSSRHHSH